MPKMFASSSASAVSLHAVLASDLEAFLEKQPPKSTSWLRTVGFRAREEELVLIPGKNGALAGAVLGLGAGRDPLALALFSERLPADTYTLGLVPSEFGGARAALAWALGCYRFGRYRKSAPRDLPKLVVPAEADESAVRRAADAIYLARDLVNTPANDMGPDELEQAARAVARKHEAELNVTTGDALLDANYPLIHAVGRASPRAPRLIDLRWGWASAPKVTLVGKGICFDTGGLDLKPSSGMAMMKKDMGGAACMLGLAQAVMDAALPVRLRLLIPAADNAISGSAYRPGDVLTSRKGLTVEIGNTDAEGRLVLADALAEADNERPDLLLCMATLTGAARAATGMELPPFFTDDETVATDLMRHAHAQYDPLWRLPLWRSYEPTIDSAIADLNNNPDYNLAGAITAALFLNRFVTVASFVHFDIPAWIDRPKPGRRKGAEANGLRALLSLLTERYGGKGH